MITIIAAMDRNRGIGKNGKLPWNIPEELAHFKSITEGGTVIMGKKTFESIGKALPNRKNVILTQYHDWFASGCSNYGGLLDAIEDIDGDIFIIGGGVVFKESLDYGYAHRIILTCVDGEFDCDTFFPEFDESKWILQKIIRPSRFGDGEINYEIRTYLNIEYVEKVTSEYKKIHE